MNKRKTSRNLIRKSIRRRKLRQMAGPTDVEQLAMEFSESMQLSTNVVRFPITQANVDGFKRIRARPMDCVINAMEILTLMDNHVAAVARILVGDIGINQEQIVGIFNVLRGPDSYEFKEVSSEMNLLNVMGLVEPSNVIFAYLQWPDMDEHVVLLLKTLQGENYVLDPQVLNPTRGGFMHTFVEYDYKWEKLWLLQRSSGENPVTPMTP